MTNYLRRKILAQLRKAFPNHEDMLTEGLGTLVVYFLYAIGIVVLLPFVLANKWFYIIDFSETGQIGDTIGGVMGPFIALIAAFLTFLAFWIQYRANEKQNAIAKKQLEMAEHQNEMMSKQTEIAQKQIEMAEEQERKYGIERFENTLHQMLDVYRQNSEAVNAGGLYGKDAFEELTAELFYIYYIIEKKLGKTLTENDYITKDKKEREIIKKYALSLYDDGQQRRRFLTTLAYELLFYGTNIVDIDKVYNHQDELLLSHELVLKVQKMFYHSNEKVTYKSLLKKITTPPIEEINLNEYSAHYQLAQGHNAQLGHYYRQMLQIVKYVSDAPQKLFDERQKYEYVKLLRSQLCDAEQILLFYNSLSIMGRAWNERHGDDDEDINTWGYILRYRMIKNIPSSFPFFGIVPTEFYKEEIKKWKQMFGEDFFENETFTKFGNFR